MDLRKLFSVSGFFQEAAAEATEASSMHFETRLGTTPQKSEEIRQEQRRTPTDEVIGNGSKVGLI
jgi:hypothetical protein